MATLVSRRLTYEDYCAIPDDGKRHEIIDGRHYVSPAPTPYHQRASKCRRLEGEAYGPATVFEGDVVRSLPDFPAMALPLAEVWR
ncbi:MAG: hypothetical protein HY719_14565 [Planctomycetes bacterium]|nr:hypothetical protein [Planctomycetota bacterium]